MLMYEAVHFHTSKLSPPKSRRIRSNGAKPELSKVRSFAAMDRLGSGAGPPQHHYQNNQQQRINRTGSFVVGQKLRESKWFAHEEIKILCAVLETGFVVELRRDGCSEDAVRRFGIALWDQGFEKSKCPEHLSICTLQECKSNFKVATIPLLEFWETNTRIRINNQQDKSNVPHKDEIIRDQIAYALANKSKWHNTEHFTYWCRYGPAHINYRSKHGSVSENSHKWGLNGFLLLKNRFRRMTTK